MDAMVVETSTPLLMYPTLPSSKQTSHHHQQWRPTLSQVVGEIKLLYSLALPMIITGLLSYGKSAISLLFMGRLGKTALAGGSLSIGIANITGYSVISGLSMGMDAISSQAHGAHQYTLMAQSLQRTIAILLCACVPIGLLWLNIQPILLLLGQDPTISSVASMYLVFSLPALFFQAFINPLKIYLRAQNVTNPLMLTAAFSLSIHGPISYFFVSSLGLGVKGIALAVAITDFTLLATLLLYLSLSGTYGKSCKVGSLPFVECFLQWKPILTLAIPSCVTVCLEWWWYELMIVLSGLLPNAAEAVSTMGVLLQATSLVYIFPWALSLAVSTRVGNELGANQPGKARTSSLVALSCAVCTSFIGMLIMTTLRNVWGRAFTVDEAILSLTAAAMPVVGLCELGNCPQTTGCGVLRGSARPALGANINLVSFYGIGLPLAIFMGFGMGLGLVGLWLGLMAAQVVCALVMVFLLMRTDWETEANRAQQLIRIDDIQEAEVKALIGSLLVKVVN